MTSHISETVKNNIWNGHLEVSRAVHYFHAQMVRYAKERNASRFAQGIAGTGALIGVLDFVPFSEIAISVTGALVAFVVIWDLVRDPAAKATRLELVYSRQLQPLEANYRDLWEQTLSDTISAAEAQEQKAVLMKELANITSILDIEDDARLATETQRSAFKVEEQRYA